MDQTGQARLHSVESPRVPVRVLIALALLCSPAAAADPWTPFRKMFPGKPPPVVAEPLPPILPPELPPPPVIMLPEPVPPPPPVVVDPVPLPPLRDKKSSSTSRSRAPARPLQITPPIADPSCAQARRGVSMSCQDILANAWIYNLYSAAKKAHSQSCLTPAERARIAACF